MKDLPARLISTNVCGGQPAAQRMQDALTVMVASNASATGDMKVRLGHITCRKYQVHPACQSFQKSESIIFPVSHPDDKLADSKHVGVCSADDNAGNCNPTQQLQYLNRRY